MMTSSDPVVWVVEDDSVMQRMIAKSLKQHDFNPVIFCSAEKAYAALGLQPLPALIILDVLLPGMSGVDLIRLLKQDKEWDKIPVVVVSVLSQVVPSVYWVRKPFDTGVLVQTIQGILASVRA